MVPELTEISSSVKPVAEKIYYLLVVGVNDKSKNFQKVVYHLSDDSKGKLPLIEFLGKCHSGLKQNCKISRMVLKLLNARYS